MKKTLVKFKEVEDSSELGYIEAVYPYNVIETISLLKIVDTITIYGESYKYAWSEFEPAISDEFLDVVIVYVDGCED